MLGLTGEADGPPVQPAGQIADLGGGGLMAAYAILAALRERDNSGEGQLVDVSMADGALSWLGMAASSYLADGRVPQRGAESLTGGFICYRPYACKDGYVTMGALEPKFWAEFCRGVGREDLIENQFEAPGSRGARRGRGRADGAHPRRVGGVRLRARLLPGAGSRSRRGARLRPRARARDGRRVRAAGSRPAHPRCRPSGQVLAHARAARRGRARSSASTPARRSPRPATATRRSPRSRSRAPPPGRPRTCSARS